MRNKICLPKKIVKIFCLFFLIIIIITFVNIINKTVLLSQNALATQSCPVPNQEVIRTGKQLCFQVCNNYGGYASQDLNTQKCCCKGNIIKLGIEGEKKCIQGGATVFQPARIEQWTNGKWKTIKTCYDNQECNPATFGCEAYKNPYNNTVTPTPIIINGVALKQYGEKCTKGLECQSGICSKFGMSTRVSVGSWGSPPSVSSVPVCQKTDSEALAIYQQIYKAEVLAQAVTTAEFVVGPTIWGIIASTYHVAAASGISAATYYFLQQPGVQKAFDVINVGGTAFSIADCLKNGAGGALCQMYVAGAATYPGEVSRSFQNSLKNLFARSIPSGTTVYLANRAVSYLDDDLQTVNRKPTSEELAWLKKVYGVETIISDHPSYIPDLDDYAAGRSVVNSKRITLYPYFDNQGNYRYDLLAGIHESGHALGVNGQIAVGNDFDLYANECSNCRWTVNQLIARGFSPQSQRVLFQLEYMNQNAQLFRQTALNSLGLVNNSGYYLSGPDLAKVYDRVLSNPSLLPYIKISDQNFSYNLQKIVSALTPR